MNTQGVVAILRADSEGTETLSSVLAGMNLRPVVHKSTDEFHRFIHQEHVDGVVIDHRLNGFLSGLDVLERLSMDLLRPTTALIGALTASERQNAKRVGVDLMLSPTATPEEIATTLGARLSATQTSAIPIPAEARKLVATVNFQGPMPQLLVKLVNYLDVEKASLKDLAEDISIDPRTTAVLLKLANSSAIGLRRKASNVTEAVNHLGIRRTVSLILTSAAVSTQRSLMRGVPPELGVWHQRRSVLIACVVSSFAGLLEQISPDTAHVMGLFQDLGILVLAHGFSTQYNALLQRVHSISQLQLSNSEMQSYGFTHAEVSAALLEKWDLPPSFVHAVLTHHGDSDEMERSDVEKRFRRVMQIGEAVADCADACTFQRKQALNRLLAHYGVDQAEACKDALQKAVAKAAELSQLFSITVPNAAELGLLVREMQGIVHSPNHAAAT